MSAPTDPRHNQARPEDDFLDSIVRDDPANRRLAGALRAWRTERAGEPVSPDERLASLFGQEPAGKQPARWRQWIQRPAVAFAASFVAVLMVGAGAFALVAGNSEQDIVAASTTSLAAEAAGGAEITLPSDLTEQADYAACVANLVGGWFSSGFAADSAPRFVDECGMPPIPDLGPEAEAFRQELQAWANCVAEEAQALLPGLAGSLGGAGSDLEGIETACGAPPDPHDYGVELPFLDWDWENIDPSQFTFGPFNLGEWNLERFNLEEFDFDEFLENLPEGFVPEDFDLERWRQQFGEFEFEGFDFDFEACDPTAGGTKELPDIESLEDLENFDFKAFLGEDCNLPFLPWNLQGFDLGNLDLEQLLGDLELNLGELDLENFDLDQLLSELFGDDGFDLGTLLQDPEQRDA